SGSPETPGQANIAARAFAQGPQSAPMAVFRAAFLQPHTAKAHEVPEAPGCRVPGVLKDGRQPRRQNLRKSSLPRRVESTGRHVPGGIRLYAVAMRPVRHGMNRVLKKARI